MGAFCSAIITETNSVASVRDTLQAVEFLTRANQQDAPGKSPIWYPWKSETLEKQRYPCRWRRSPKRELPFDAPGGDLGVGKTLCTCGSTKSHRNATRLSCQGSSRRSPDARTWRDRSPRIFRHTGPHSRIFHNRIAGRTCYHATSSMHSQFARPHRTLKQPLVLNMAKARRQAVFLTAHHPAGKRTLTISHTEYKARRAPGCARVACPQLRVATITDNGVVQVWCIRAHIRNARQILRLEDVQKTLIGPPKKACGKSTELLDPDTQLTVPSSSTNLLEQSSLVPSRFLV